MSRNYLLLISLVLWGLLQIDARADLHCRTTVVDAGEVRAGQPLVREFTFVNEGPESVELLEALPSCGCLRPRLEQKTLRPGEEGTLPMEVNTPGQPAGPHTWQIRLQYRRGEHPEEVILLLQARIITELTVQPAAITFLTQGALAQDVVVTDSRLRFLRIQEVRTTSPHLKATLRDNMDTPSTFRIKVEAEADYPAGRHEEVLSIYTNDPLYQLLKVPVTVVRGQTSRLAVTPPEVSASAAPGAPMLVRLLLVRDAQGEPVLVENVTADDPAIRCRWAEGPDKMATVRLLIDPTQIRGSMLQSTVNIQVARPVRETLTIPVRCNLE